MVTIIREIDGVPHEFVLTDDELFNAYVEQEHKFDVENVRNAIDDISNELADELAYAVRREIDKYNLDFFDAIGSATVGFNKLLRKDRIEHTNLQAMLENGNYESSAVKHRLEERKLSLEKYWGEYLHDINKEL